MRFAVVAALLTASCGDDLRHADAYLLGDLNEGPAPSYPSSLTSSGPRAWFVAFDDGGAADASLYVTNARADGTVALAHFEDFPRNLAAIRGQLLFTAGNEGSWGVWTSDGTVDGTVRLRDLATPPDDGFPRAASLVAGGRYYLSVDGAHGAAAALWRSDGTAEGTIVLAPFSGELIGALGDVCLLFNRETQELWRSQGMPFDTEVVTSIPGIWASGSAALGDRLYFVVEGESGRAMWRSDGTAAGTEEAFALSGDRVVTAMAASGNRLVYATTTEAGTGELWTSDGGEPVKIADRAADEIVAIADAAYAFGLDGVSRIDGTSVTRLGDAVGAHAPITLYDRIVFAAFDPRYGDELWVTDGTPSGTRLALDLVPGEVSSSAGQLTTVGGMLVFTANVPPYGDEPWAIAQDDLVGNR